MEILLGFIFGATIGGVLHFLQPGRDARGTALSPIVGASVGGFTWLALTWAGIGADNPWIWVLSIVVPGIVVPIMLVLLTRSRAQHDAQERLRLKIA
ncbi:hypothetical protein [Microbacterium memoriense]|uniref:Uncharacterized protein n=1 Tax=Microbacterium memoriense TaxID=2978350 RepID=A0ABT2PBM3_9MICO|nr:hypothetical protein [Microbacterium memoriense]MCT9001418.1 hypothetical protein [Microbacterium memoriense]